MIKIIRKTAKTLLPKSTTYRLKRQLEENRFKAYALEKLDLNYRQVDSSSIPPKELIAQTAALDEEELERQCNGDVYLETGYFEVLRIFKILSHFGINPENYRFGLRTRLRYCQVTQTFSLYRWCKVSRFGC